MPCVHCVSPYIIVGGQIPLDVTQRAFIHSFCVNGLKCAASSYLFTKQQKKHIKYKQKYHKKALKTFFTNPNQINNPNWRETLKKLFSKNKQIS